MVALSPSMKPVRKKTGPRVVAAASVAVVAADVAATVAVVAAAAAAGTKLS